MAHRIFTEEESRIVREGRQSGLTYRQITALLPGRNYNAVKTHALRKAVTPKRKYRRFDCDEASARMAAQAADEKFQRLLRAAIDAGVERLPEVKANPKAPRGLPRHFDCAPIFSGCSSAAGLCADLGDKVLAQNAIG